MDKVTYCIHLTHTGSWAKQDIVLYNFVCFYLNRYPDSPMRMADRRSLLASLTGLVSPLLPSLCPGRCEGAAGGGRGGGGGPGGGGGMMRGPGGGTGGSG